MTYVRNILPVAHEELVANINEAITRTVQSAKGGREPFIAPLGPVSKTSNGKEAKLDFHKFVYGLLVRRSVHLMTYPPPTGTDT